MRATSIVAIVAALAPAALAAPAFTEPISSTTCTAGTACNIAWKDDGNAPLNAAFGDAMVALCTGSAQQQTCLQQLGATNAATAPSMSFVPDPSVGEDSTAYFIKMVSVNTADPAMPQYKASAYSAMFTLKGMTGKFNETIQAQIAGTAPPSSGVVGGGASTVVVTVTSTSAGASKAAAAATSKTTSAAATGSAAPSTNGAASVAVGAGMFGASVLAALAAIF